MAEEFGFAGEEIVQLRSRRQETCASVICSGASRFFNLLGCDHITS